MSQMPDKVLIHKDEKYNTGDFVIAYQYEFAEKVQEQGTENFVEYVPKDMFIEKAINFLEMLGYGFTITDDITHSNYKPEQLIEDFKDYMKDKL